MFTTWCSLNNNARRINRVACVGSCLWKSATFLYICMNLNRLIKNERNADLGSNRKKPSTQKHLSFVLVFYVSNGQNNIGSSAWMTNEECVRLAGSAKLLPQKWRRKKLCRQPNKKTTFECITTYVHLSICMSRNELIQKIWLLFVSRNDKTENTHGVRKQYQAETKISGRTVRKMFLWRKKRKYNGTIVFFRLI